jgi:pimeloyl-ACP methyl ester carboxylesterase
VRLGIALVGGIALSALEAQSPLSWIRCDAAAPGSARCGLLVVPENRDSAAGPTVRIAFTVLSAYGERRSADPVLILLGGPGEAASNRLRALAAAHSGINRSRDVIFVDQRGTGRSSPLGCEYGRDDDLQSYLDFLPTDAVRACVALLPPSIDVARYGTRDFVADLDALRTALGIARWNLHGASYGSRVALEYMMRHTGSIRSAVLVGVAPQSQVIPRSFGKDANRALRLLIADCRADRECAAAFPGFAEEMDSIGRRLERAPVDAPVRHPRTGERSRVRFSRAAFGEVVRALMYTPRGARSLPLAVHEAYLGDYSALATAHLRRQRVIAREGWTGLYLAVTCAEDVVRADEASTIAENRGTILGADRARQHFAACAVWPRGKRIEEARSHSRIRTPVLMIVGDRDPVTPPSWAREARRTMESAQLVIVPGGSHGFTGMAGIGCLQRLESAFFETPAAALDASCVASMRPPPFLLAR